MSAGRRLSQWRRLVLVFAPASAKRVALALSEFAWTEDDDPNGALVAKHCTQEILRRICDYKSPRGLLLQLEKLEQAGWIERDDWQTGPGAFREYTLKTPSAIPESAICELEDPSPGMWKRLLDGDTERTRETQFTCSDPVKSSIEQYQVNSSSENVESGELGSNNRCTPVPNQVHCISPLKESLSKSLGVYSQKGGLPQAATRSDFKKTNSEEHVSHVADVLPVQEAPNEEVRHGDEVLPTDGISDFKRAAVLKLAQDGCEPALIATMAGIGTETVAELLREAL